MDTERFSMARKIAPGSLWKMSDQERWYREQMGDVAADRQGLLAKKEHGQCICTQPLKERMLKRKWDGEKMTVRAVHMKECPKWKKWMDLV